jgi:hypothetical protein
LKNILTNRLQAVLIESEKSHYILVVLDQS